MCAPRMRTPGGWRAMGRLEGPLSWAAAGERAIGALRARLPAPGRFVFLLVAAFVTWGLVLSPVMPSYGAVVGALDQWALDGLTLHGTDVTVTGTFPRFEWALTGRDGPIGEDSVSTWLVCYNSALYLSLVTVCFWRTPALALLVAVTGFPFLFLFHTADVLLAVESWLQSRLHPEYYAFLQSFNLRFVVVKFMHHFSMLAFKQVSPILLVLAQAVVAARYGILKCEAFERSEK